MPKSRRSGAASPWQMWWTAWPGSWVYRHPHVFGDVQADTSQQVLANWDVLKRREKGQRSTADAMEAVPRTLPACGRAEKIQSKTAQGRL